MKGFFGFILLIFGIGLIISAVVGLKSYAFDWPFIIGAGLLGWGLDLIKRDTIDDAKSEILKELGNRGLIE